MNGYNTVEKSMKKTFLSLTGLKYGRGTAYIGLVYNFLNIILIASLFTDTRIW